MGADEANRQESPRRRLIYVWNYRNWGGAQIYFASLIPLAREHFDVCVAMPTGSERQVVDKFTKLGAEILFLDDQIDIEAEQPVSAKITQHFRKVSADFSLVRQLSRRFEPADTILHIDLGFWSSLIVLARLASRYHVFFTIHTPLDAKSVFRGFLWRLKGRAIGRWNGLHFLASNQAAAKSLNDFVPNAPRPDVPVAYSGIDVAEIELVLRMSADKNQVRSQIGVSADDQLIILVGQFIRRKGAKVLIDALPKIAARAPGAKVVWLTMKKPDGELAEQAAQASTNYPFQVYLGDDVGGRRGVMELQCSADLFVLPSLEEGLPIALVEAMALGVPCIASDVGAVSEAIADGETGILIKHGNADQLANAIVSLLADREMRNYLSDNAKKCAIEKFDSHSASRITVENYLRFGELRT